MDNSKGYVVMCDCPEIQSFKRSQEFTDFLYHGFVTSDEMQDVWLPRQDQLQDMIQGRWALHKDLSHDFSFMVIFDTDPDLEMRCVASTSEQAFLQFVMLKLYHKKWNGEEWVIS